MIDEHQERYYKKTPNKDNRTKNLSSSSFASNLSEISFEEEASELKLNRSKNK